MYSEPRNYPERKITNFVINMNSESNLKRIFFPFHLPIVKFSKLCKSLLKCNENTGQLTELMKSKLSIDFYINITAGQPGKIYSKEKA